jgi:hypothetical protein
MRAPHIRTPVTGLRGIRPPGGGTTAAGDGLLDNMLAVLTCPRATATVKSSALEVEGFARRHLVVCGTEGTVHIQPLDSPSARVSLSRARGGYRKGTQEVTFPRYTRYVGDAVSGTRRAPGPPAGCEDCHSTADDVTNVAFALGKCVIPNEICRG